MACQQKVLMESDNFFWIDNHATAAVKSELGKSIKHLQNIA